MAPHSGIKTDLASASRPRGPLGPELPKAPTGIAGLDEVTGGGLPKGRPTLVCGPAGSGKTLLATEFLVRGITEYGEPGVFVAFEETARDLVENVASLGFDLTRLERDGRLIIDHVAAVGAQVETSGPWDLDGLILRLGSDIDEIGAKRVVIDTIETLFGEFDDTALLRSELHRLFAWLKERGVTTVVTGERGEGTLTRHGIEAYVADCVIALDHRVSDQTSTRRLRVIKYRGSFHGTNEYPFLIGRAGISVLPVTSLALRNDVSTERVSSGVDRLDAMLEDGGYFKGSAILVSGSPGTGKSTLAAQFCASACGRGEKALYFAFEESQAEIIRNMASVGIDLQPGVDDGRLHFRCSRPSHLDLEAHLVAMLAAADEIEPAVVVMDPISDLLRIGNEAEVAAMLTREIDVLKARGITVLFTNLAVSGRSEGTQQVASLVDTWLLLESVEGNGEHNRLLSVLKARGTAHSNQIREFLLTSDGIGLADVYVGPEGVLTGSARQAQEASERDDSAKRAEDLSQRRKDLDRRREMVEAETAALWRDFEIEADAVERTLSHGTIGVEDREGQRAEQGRLRQADVGTVPPGGGRDTRQEP